MADQKFAPNTVAEWQITASEANYLRVRDALREYAANMQKTITEENNHYRSQIEDENSNYSQTLEQIKFDILDTPNKNAKAEYDATLQECHGKKNRMFKATRDRANSLGIEFRSDTLFFKLGKYIVRRRDADHLRNLEMRKAVVDKEESSLSEAVNRVADKAKKLYDAKVRMHTRNFENEKATASKEHSLKLENLKNMHDNEISTIVRGYEEEFSRHFNKNTFTTAYDLARTMMRQATNYTCSDKLPEALYFGIRTFTVENLGDDFSPEVTNMFRRIDHPAVTANNKSIVISLPFFRSLNEGYSIFLDVADAASGTSNQIIWEYTMKVLMNFPAGQTRPLLLDCDSTTELTDFKVIGDSSGRNLNTKTWTEERDIETELKNMSTENTNLTSSYGKDVASRMKREPIYMVACRNFPRKITDTALSSLVSIISAGSARGFFGIIQGSSNAISVRSDDVDFLASLDTIRSNCLCVKETNAGYTIDGESFSFEKMDAIHTHKDTIFSHLITGVARYRRQIEKFEYLFSKDAGNIERMDVHDVNTWFRGDASRSLSVPIGISGASTVQKYTIDGTAQHGLISGVTGSGKSTLLKTMIIAAMIKYSPDNLHLYLVDFKEGVEFAPFSDYKLPWIKVIALNTQRIFALNILKDLQKEFRHRADVMRNQNTVHISRVNEKFPRLWLVFDEVQALLSVNDSITRSCIEILSELVSEGRAMNINVIIASQNFSICQGIQELKANMVLRITMRGSPESAKIVMGSDFNVDQLEQGDAGTAAINTASGTRGQTTFFQVGYMSDTEMKTLLSQLSTAWACRPAETRIMSTHVSQDRNAKFNRLITDGTVEYSTDPGSYELMLGDEFIMDRKRKIAIDADRGENLMVIGENEDTAKSIFALTMLSALYGELSSRAQNIEDELIRVIDMSDDYMPNAEYLSQLASRFNRQINLVPGKRTADMIDDTYRVLIDRKRGRTDKSQRLFFMIFGMDSLHILKPGMLSAEEDDLSLNQKLLQIIQQGPDLGINCILWCRSYEGFKTIIDTATIAQNFNKRIHFGSTDESANVLGIRQEMADIGEKSVAYRDMFKAAPSTFRVFELPNEAWLNSITRAYIEFRHRT